jgi:hypothetical protein
MAQNLAAKYSKKVDEKFFKELLTEPAMNQDYEWSGVATVTVYGVDTVSNVDYTRSGTSRYGTPSELGTTKKDYTLSQDRSATWIIDRGNYTESQMVTESGKSMSRQEREVDNPEVDTYRLAAMDAAAVANGSTATAAVSASNAYEKFLDGQVTLDDALVPSEGRIAFVTPSYHALLKQDSSFILNSDRGQVALFKGECGEVDGVRIIKVPSSYFPANTAFIITHKAATCAPTKLEDMKIHDNPPGISGWLCEKRRIYDAFVLEQKKDAIYTHKTA